LLGFDEVGKITIVPRSNGAGGFTLFLPSDEQQDSGMYTRSYLEGRLKVALGGRVAEELAYGKEEITTGASSDLQSDLLRQSNGERAHFRRCREEATDPDSKWGSLVQH